MTTLEWLIRNSSLEYVANKYTTLDYFLAPKSNLVITWVPDAVIVDTSYQIDVTDKRIISEVVSSVNRDSIIEEDVVDTVDSYIIEEVISESS